MSVFGLVVGRNETQRYLRPMLEALVSTVDAVFFYDDCSEDDTAVVAHDAGCNVFQRDDQTPSFLENEGLFRGGAWKMFESTFFPRPQNDWVLVIDCDEVLVGIDYKSQRLALKSAIEVATESAIDLNIPEVFGFSEIGQPLVRVDRLWGTIHAPRLFRYESGARYPSHGFGVPAVPSYVMGRSWGSTTLLALMHYGYAAEKDQQAKFNRYTGRLGHSNEHVQSILAADKILERWPYPYVDEMRTWNLPQ